MKLDSNNVYQYIHDNLKNKMNEIWMQKDDQAII